MEQRERLLDEKLAELGDKVKDLDASINEAQKLRLLGDVQKDIIKILEDKKIKTLKEIDEQKKFRGETNEVPSKKSDRAEEAPFMAACGLFMAEDGGYVVMNKDTINTILRKLMQDMNKATEESKKVLQEVDKKIAAIDLRYAKMLVKEEIDTLKTAKQILESRDKKQSHQLGS